MSRGNLWLDPALAKSVCNALVATRAVYSENDVDCQKFLSSNPTDHSLSCITRTKHSECAFLLAEDLDRSTLYVAFRGSQSNDDWKTNLAANLVEGSRADRLLQGRLHDGFLARAQQFPINMILNEKHYRDMNIVLCGHSLGGAVATVVSILLLLELERRQQTDGDKDQRWVRCITFGAPIVGNQCLREFCDKKDISQHMFHFTCDEDPVPRILGYSHSLSTVAATIDSLIKKSAKNGNGFISNDQQLLADKLLRYKEILGKVEVIFMDIVMPATELLFPQLSEGMFIARSGFNIINNLVQSSCQESSQSLNNAYVPVGNYLFFSLDSTSVNKQSFFSYEIIDQFFEQPLKETLAGAPADIPVFHGIDNYELFTHEWARQVGKLPNCTNKNIPRNIKFVCRFLPVINVAKLIRVQSPSKDILRLELTGKNLSNCVLNECCFTGLGIPFGLEGKVCIKKVTFDSTEDTVWMEEPFVASPHIPVQHGILIRYATQFGSCEFLLRKEHTQNIPETSSEEAAYQDSISILIKRAILRGMAIQQIQYGAAESEWKSGTSVGISHLEEILHNVLNLSKLTLQEKDAANFSSLLDAGGREVDFWLNNDRSTEIQDYCDKMQEYLNNPLKIDTKTGLPKKIGFGFASMAGLAGAAAMLASSYASAGVALVAGIFATLSTKMWSMCKTTNANYQEVLLFITLQLLQKLANDKKMAKNLLQKVEKLLDEGSILSLESAMLLLYDCKLGIGNFVGYDLENSTKKCRQNVKKRIECVIEISNIRHILSKQCFIGIVGLQNAGKTTLLNKLWEANSKTGNLSHTDRPMIYKIDSKVLVVDFPGSDSLDSHAKTFANCGSMNNLIIIVVPYSGDISLQLSEQLLQAFSALANSASAQVLLCVNQCGYQLPKDAREELPDQDNPVDYLQRRYASRLNKHFQEAGYNFTVAEKSIMFTDWIATKEELGGLAICGVEDVRNEIGQYLLSHGVFQGANGLDTKALERCLHVKLAKPEQSSSKGNKREAGGSAPLSSQNTTWREEREVADGEEGVKQQSRPGSKYYFATSTASMADEQQSKTKFNSKPKLAQEHKPMMPRKSPAPTSAHSTPSPPQGISEKTKAKHSNAPRLDASSKPPDANTKQQYEHVQAGREAAAQPGKDIYSGEYQRQKEVSMEFSASPILTAGCFMCGSLNHTKSRFNKKTGQKEAHCPVFIEQENNGFSTPLCQYPACRFPTMHQTSTCYDLMRPCTRCNMRGHHANNCRTKRWAEWRSLFERHADENYHTRKRWRQPAWGVVRFRSQEHFDRFLQKYTTYESVINAPMRDVMRCVLELLNCPELEHLMTKAEREQFCVEKIQGNAGS